MGTSQIGLKQRKRVVWGAVICLVWSLLFTYPASLFAESNSEDSIPEVIESTTRSVVAIIGKPVGERKVWESNRYDLAHGTGVIVREDGYIVTNAHVVKDMRNIVVVTTEGKSYSGQTTHYDEESDLALIKIDAKGLKKATFADPQEIKVGETVMAIGTPLSFALRNSVTQGIISGMERSVQSKYQLIQTDAAINPGNSGGALVNMNGHVVGINTMKYVQVGVDSLGFAIPVDTVQYVLDHFFTYGKVKRPYLGIELGESWEAVVGLPTSEGLEIMYVQPDSPASKAGLRQGDILQAVGTQKVHTLVEYNEIMKRYIPDEKVKLTYISSGSKTEAEIVLGEDLTADTKLPQDADGSSIDDDLGKTRIGDSGKGWSMRYPAGLIKTDQTEDGSSISFTDSKGEYTLNILVEEHAGGLLSPLGLLRKLYATSETIIEKRYVDRDKEPYGLLIGRTADDEYVQMRVFQNEQNLYYVMLHFSSEDLYNNEFKRNGYNDLLDSFTLSFDSKDASLKDLSVEQDHQRLVTDYGLVLDIPTEWGPGWFGSGINYYSEDYSRYLNLTVTSAAAGDTLRKWAERQEKEFLSMFLEKYRTSTGLKETVIDGIPTIQVKYGSTMGDEWAYTDTVYLIKEGYKFKLEIHYSKTDEEEMSEVVDDIISSISWDSDAQHRLIGNIQDEEDWIDKNRKITYKNKKYKYSMSVPEYWNDSYGNNTESSEASFYFIGGSFSISADAQSKFEDVIKDKESEHKEYAKADSDYSYSVTEKSMFDTKTKVFTVQYSEQDVPYTLEEYVFEGKGIVYTVEVYVNDAAKTEELWSRITETVQSIMVTR
jgi:serine protease Do